MLAEIDGPGEALMAIAMMSIAAGVLVTFIRSRERKERLRVIEKALHADALDDETRRAIVNSLSAEAREGWPQWLANLYQGVVYLCRHAIFVCGWIGMFVGIALMLVGDQEMFTSGVIGTLVSLGVVTVPLALRELEARRETRSGV
jgi:hypothetical protein